jgi:hypothetical protein
VSTQTLSPAPIPENITDRRASPIWQTWFSRVAGVVNAAFAAYDTAIAPLTGGHTSWQPGVFPTGSQTLSAWTYYDGYYWRCGPRLFLQFQITFTLGGTPSNQLTIPLPVAALAGFQSNSASGLTCNVWVNAAAGGGWQPAFAYVYPAGNQIVVQLPNAVNFANGITWLMLSGSYRVA